MRPNQLGPRRPPTVAASWERQSWPLRILRAFLGVTFVYAGIQKMADRNFLRPGTPDYIGSQLRSFERGSPIHPLLGFFAHLPGLTGVGIALTEMTIGLATLLGIGAIVAAAVGLAINVVLFLSATWHVHPYFLGSDSIYAVAWAAYLAGLVEIHRRIRVAPIVGTRRQRAAALEGGLGRREFLRGAFVGMGTLILGAASTTFAGSPTRTTQSLPTQSPSPSPSHRTRHSKPATQIQGTPIASTDSVPVGGVVPFDDATQGPAILVRLSQDQVAAYSRSCTHAGCLVDYDQPSGLLVCPCHGAEFDPAHGAQVVVGPAPTPLPSIPVAIDRSTGTIVAKS
jgi:thiosulfate dehydrogenase [quinone] large subunit